MTAVPFEPDTHPAVETPARAGGDVLVETLQALGITTLFGEPGQHALGIMEALRRRSDLRFVGLRTELAVAFAADGYARASGQVGALVVSTGPGALLTLPALQEAAAASVPLLCIASQVPRAGLGGARRGYLHELTDQRASFRDIVGHTVLARQASQIPSAVAEAWAIAMSAPTGPVWVEIPEDVLLEPTTVPPVADLAPEPRHPAPRRELVELGARWLDSARAPVIVAGGGVVRADARAELRALAEKLQAPVVTTFGGKGAFPWEHPLSLQSWLEDRATTQLLEDADVLLCVGTGLGELTSNYHSMSPRGRLIQVDADLGRLEANHPALGIHADARHTLTALLAAVSRAPRDGRAAERVRALLQAVGDRLSRQELTHEQQVLAAIRAGVPDDVLTVWDMTIAGYWAWSAWDARDAGQMLSPQGSGVLGYAFPAALGVAASGSRVLAVSGDGGAMYGIGELATAREQALDITWLVVDDGGYGILREYQQDRFGHPFASDLVMPDFVALAHAFGVPASTTSPDRLERDLARELSADGPSVLHLRTSLRMFEAS